MIKEYKSLDFELQTMTLAEALQLAQPMKNLKTLQSNSTYQMLCLFTSFCGILMVNLRSFRNCPLGKFALVFQKRKLNIR